jgi:hypothetical protein
LLEFPRLEWPKEAWGDPGMLGPFRHTRGPFAVALIMYLS